MTSKLKIIQPGVGLISLPVSGPLDTVNSYLLWGDDAAYLVDLGLDRPEHMEAVLGALHEVGLSPTALTGIVITHTHIDHIGLLNQFRARWDVPVLLHHWEVWFLERRNSYGMMAEGGMAGWYREHGVGADLMAELEQVSMDASIPVPFGEYKPLDEGDTLQVGHMSWQILLTPGHSPAHLCLWEPTSGLLITGDQLLPNETSNVSLVPGVGDNPLVEYLQGLDRIESLPVRLALPGHSDPFANVGAHVQRVRAHHDLRISDIKQALAPGAVLTALEVACQIPWAERRKRFAELAPFDKRLALGETVAHLRYLEQQGVVLRKDGEGGRITWGLPTA